MVSITEQATLPSGAVLPQARQIHTVHSASLCNSCTITPLVYLTVQVNPTATITQWPAVTVTLPSNVAVTPGNAYLLLYQNGTWTEVAGPVAASSSFGFNQTATNPSPFTLTSGTNYTFAVVTTGTATLVNPTPTPIPAGAYIFVPNNPHGNGSGTGATSILAYPVSASGSPAPAYTIASSNPVFAGGSSIVNALTTDASNNLYVAISTYSGSLANTIDVFAPGANGNVTPIRSIGNDADFNSPGRDACAVATDAQGNLFVGFDTTPQIEEFSSSANGAASPTRSITLNAPSGNGPGAVTALAVTADGTIYATVEGASGVFSAQVTEVIPPGASAPSANAPIRANGLATDSSGNVYESGGSGSLPQVAYFPSGSNSYGSFSIADGTGGGGVAVYQNNIFVAPFFSTAEKIAVIPTGTTGSVTPSREISLPAGFFTSDAVCSTSTPIAIGTIPTTPVGP